MLFSAWFKEAIPSAVMFILLTELLVVWPYIAEYRKKKKQGN